MRRRFAEHAPELIPPKGLLWAARAFLRLALSSHSVEEGSHYALDDTSGACMDGEAEKESLMIGSDSPKSYFARKKGEGTSGRGKAPFFDCCKQCRYMQEVKRGGSTTAKREIRLSAQ